MVDAGDRDRILAAARALGPERFNDLVRSAAQARSLGRLRYWQEQRFAALAGAAGVAAAGLDDFLAVFEEAEPIPVPVSEPTPEDYVAAWRANVEWRGDFVFWVAREVSKNGTLGAHAHVLAALATGLRRDEVLWLHEQVRLSRRPEREWRGEFLALFRQVGPADLPPLQETEAEAARAASAGREVPWPATPPDEPGPDNEIPF